MDDNDEGRNIALLVVAAAVALVIAGVLTLAVHGGAATHRSGSAATGVPGPGGAAIAGTPDGRIYFAVDADTLPADANEVLVRVADTARSQDGKVVLISGFHDASGDPAKNAELAKRRAEAVRHALEANGVAPERLVLDKPAVTTGGADPREARRVEMRLR